MVSYWERHKEAGHLVKIIPVDILMFAPKNMVVFWQVFFVNLLEGIRLVLDWIILYHPILLPSFLSNFFSTLSLMATTFVTVWLLALRTEMTFGFYITKI